MKTITIRDREGVLAAVPLVLGFHPQDSLVVLGFGGGSQPHARCDYADAEGTLPLVLDVFRRNEVRMCVVVVYTGDGNDPLGIMDLARSTFAEAGILVADAFVTLNADTGDDRHHGLRDINDTRESLVDELTPTVEVQPGSAVGLDDLVAGLLRTDIDPGDVLTSLLDIPTRDALLDRIARDNDRLLYRAVLQQVVRVAPPGEYRAMAASVLAFAEWQIGDGARAWVARDVAAAEGGTSLNDLVTALLEQGVNPKTYLDN